MPANPDLCSALSDATLKTFRAQYKPDGLLRASRAAVAAPHPSAEAYVEFITGYLYDPKRLKPVERERCLIALLASQNMASNSLMLGIHIYWGLMEGLSVAEVADALCLAGAYTGVAHYSAGLGTFRKVIDVMNQMVEKKAALDPMTVVAQLFSGLC